MRLVDLAARWALALALYALGCDATEPDDPGVIREVTAPTVTSEASGSGVCALSNGCVDLAIGPLSTAACCSPKVSCGYRLPEPDAETLRLFPQVTDFYAKVTGEPNGRCAPTSFFFGPRPGLEEQRFEPEGSEEDILVTPDCESFTLAAFILPGCCLPDNSCGLSTHESWSTLEYLANEPNVPFARPECVSAAVLNQQFRDSAMLQAFARTTTSGTCDFAALEARLPSWF